MRFIGWTALAAFLVLSSGSFAVAAPPAQAHPQADRQQQDNPPAKGGPGDETQSGIGKPSPAQSPGSGSHDGDQEDALHAVQSGAALPLSSIVNALGLNGQARLLDAHLIHRNGRLLYELTIQVGSELEHVLIDAKSGRRISK